MNPYELLNIEKDASKKDIIKAAACALRERKYTAKEIANAQKTLLSSTKKFSEAISNIDFSIIYNNFEKIKPADFSTKSLDKPIKL